MFKMTVTYDELSYLLALIKNDINNDRELDLDPAQEAFDLEAKLVAARQERDERDPIDTPDRESWAEAQGEA